uniref:G-protein coupled receptors family 1 profile domain-containing protein n=1 Tax=Leptobrachium leishanense TaxID=445787 RepID=A0A8C5PP63_9ANUR
MTTRILITSILFVSMFILCTECCRKVKKQPRVLLLDNCNASFLEPNIKIHLASPITTLYIPIFYSVVFFLGLPANGVAIWVFVFKTKKMPSTLLLINLAAADLVFMMALPFKIIYHFFGNNWIFGEIFCRITTSGFYGNMYCSVFFLMAISIDRYIALVHPFSCKALRGWMTSIIVCTVTWLIVASGSFIFAFFPQTKTFTDPNITTCHDIWAMCSGYEWYNYYFLGLFGIGFTTPLLIILFCYIRVIMVLIRSKDSHRNVIRVIFLVLFTFIVCFTPSNILLLLHYLEYEWECHNQLYLWYTLALSLTSLNSCINPFIYFYMSQDFRSAVKNALCGLKEGNSESSRTTKRSKIANSSENEHKPSE